MRYPTLALLLISSILALAHAEKSLAADSEITGDFTLSYWDVRGLAQPLKEFARYVGLKFTDHRYSGVDPSLPVDDPRNVAAQASNDSYWLHKERQLTEGNYFINLPGIEFTNSEGHSEYVSESEAIFLWMVQKSGRQELIPQTMADRIKYTQLEGVIKDIATQLRTLCYTEKTLESLKTTLVAKYETLAKSKLKGLWKVLEHYDWVMGDNITVQDFKFAELVNWAFAIEKSLGIEGGFRSENYSFGEYLERYQALPEIAAYMNEEDYIMRPFNGRRAVWSGA